MTGRRPWPIHPVPLPGEALLSWLGRIAHCYSYTVADLLTGDLGITACKAEHLDVAAPSELMAALSARTGQSVDRIRRMTLTGGGSDILDLKPIPVSWPRHRSYGRRRSFIQATWDEVGLFDRIHACRACLAEAPMPWIRLAWCIPWIGSCPDHGLRLERASILPGSLVFWDAPGSRAASEAMRAMDRLSMVAIEGEPQSQGQSTPGNGRFGRLRRALEELQTSLRAGVAHETDGGEGALSGADLRRLASRPFELLSRQDQLRMLELVAQKEVGVQSSANKSAIHFEH
jgi:TniQ